MNLRPSGYEPDELPGCSIPRWLCFYRFIEIMVLSRFGGDLLSQGLSPSTIGAEALNFRVRDGTGCFALAVATKPRQYRASFLFDAYNQGCPSFVLLLVFDLDGVCFLHCLFLDQIKPIGRLVPVN